ncbi:hypothetical protein B0O99DRAFT_739471 [Bisporella sp. PMI_857]|nr:hypothetical protein B0O99DRAFT_739471 [Bisporella sp. PMI_857]
MTSFHGGTRVPKPHIPTPPPSSEPPPARYPETLGTLLEMRASPGRGLGMFALVDIPSGTLLLAETPLITVSFYAPFAGLIDAPFLLTVSQADAYYSLSPYSGHKTRSLLVKILDRNAFEIVKGDRNGIFETGSRINHSCVPNSEFEWVTTVGRMVFWNR